MKPALLFLFLTGCSLLSLTFENYVIDNYAGSSSQSLEVKIEYLNRNKRLSDTSELTGPNITTPAPTPEVPAGTGNSTSEETSDDGSTQADNTADTTTSDNSGSEDTGTDDDGSSSSDISGLDVEDEIKEYCKNENNTCSEDRHKYYKAIYITGDTQSQWKELAPDQNPVYQSTKHINLSTSEPKRGYKLQPGEFSLTDFLFYGQPVTNEMITILTGGFMHVGDILSPKVVSFAQYIAPFMGNFHPNASSGSNVYYYGDENIFIVQWDKMQIANASEKGNFTFQLQLHKNNDIVFAYKELPVVTLEANDHENAIGLSDAFHIVTPAHLMIHVYHKLDVNKTKIRSGSSIRLQALQSCSMIKDCYNCTTVDLPEFECKWCGKAQMCSDKHGDTGHSQWYRDCQVNNKEKGQMCDEYCYLPTHLDADEVNRTTYTPTPELPIIPANPNGTSRVQIDCVEDYAVSVRYHLSAADKFSCTTGGIELPTCQKSCVYTTAPTNGKLLGVEPGVTVKPDKSFTVTCNQEHRLRNKANRNVTCIDPGVLEPDPANIKCEKFCKITHPHNAEYNPPPEDNGFLHEGDVITMTCADNYAFDAFLRGTQQNNSLILNCQEESDFSDLDKMCVGYCKVAQHPNTTYEPLIAMIGEKITIKCANHTFLTQAEAEKEYICQQPGPLMIPSCQTESDEEAEGNSGTTSHSLTILLIIFILTIVCIVGGWVLYAYRNPTSPSGLFLIEKCRPWTWRSHTYSRHQESLAESYYMDGGI